MFAPPFSGLQQILKAEQPFMAVQSKAGFWILPYLKAMSGIARTA